MVGISVNVSLRIVETLILFLVGYIAIDIFPFKQTHDPLLSYNSITTTT